MSIVTATSLSDSLSSSMPKLESTGTNWAVFEIHFCDAIEAKGFWDHFNGTSIHPVTVSITALNGTISIDTTPVDQWDKDEHLAKSLLNQKIPVRLRTIRTDRQQSKFQRLQIVKNGEVKAVD